MTQLSDLYSCNYTLIYDITLDIKIVAYELWKLQDMSYSEIIFLFKVKNGRILCGWHRLCNKARCDICITTGMILRMVDIGTIDIRVCNYLFTISNVYIQYLTLVYWIHLNRKC